MECGLYLNKNVMKKKEEKFKVIVVKYKKSTKVGKVL